MKEKIIEACKELDRGMFMEECREFAHYDSPFPIGHGQTILQPSLVLKMTLALEPDADSKVLEIGTGSGYQTALLAELSKNVYTVERIKDLHDKAKKRLEELNHQNIEYKIADTDFGWEEHAPFDRIIVTSPVYNLPENLINQLAFKGKMVIPIKVNGVEDLLLIEKNANGHVSKEIIGKVKMVDLIYGY